MFGLVEPEGLKTLEAMGFSRDAAKAALTVTAKGFEGAVSLRGKDGVLYILGLCEGNFCSEERGKEVGNGRVVVMAREDKADAPGGCEWKTARLTLTPEP